MTRPNGAGTTTVAVTVQALRLAAEVHRARTAGTAAPADEVLARARAEVGSSEDVDPASRRSSSG